MAADLGCWEPGAAAPGVQAGLSTARIATSIADSAASGRLSSDFGGGQTG
ncbi:MULTISPECIES: hypothetical protein [Amycolatopsis]